MRGGGGWTQGRWWAALRRDSLPLRLGLEPGNHEAVVLSPQPADKKSGVGESMRLIPGGREGTELSDGGGNKGQSFIDVCDSAET